MARPRYGSAVAHENSSAAQPLVVSRIRWVQVMAVGTVGPGFRYTEALPAPHNTTTIVRIVDEEGREGLGGYDADSGPDGL